MASRQCLDDREASDQIFDNLDYWQKVVEHNCANLRVALNIPSPEELLIKLTFENDDWWRTPILYPPIKQVTPSLTFQR